MLTSYSKNQQVRAGFLKILAVVVLIIIFCGSFLYAIFHADFLAVKEYKVLGLRVIPESSFLEAIKLDSASNWLGIFGPDRILNWRSGERQVLVGANDPYLANVHTEVNWFKRTVDFVAEEKKTSFIWCREENCFVTDEEGKAFAIAPDYGGHLIIEIKDQRLGNLAVGFKVLEDSDIWNNLKKNILEIKSSGIGLIGIKILEEESREWQAVLAHGGVLKFSLDKPIEDLSSILNRLSKDVDLEKMEYADFRVPGRVYFK
jgi:cell division septal protein FtsQ